MSLLIPLGLLGLLSIIALILIYVIKPNYQQKRVSSTYVWKLSLKYKKKRIPVSRLSQIIIFICQLLILTLCALLLARPTVLEERVDYKAESVVIIDASASMMVNDSGETRFERAVAQVKEYADEVLSNDGVISVILADYDAHFLAQRSGASDLTAVSDALDELQAAGTEKCTYGSADMEGAVALAEQVLEINSSAKVYLYTATQYVNKNGINVISVAEEDEWNAAVLDCKAKLEDDNFYSVSVNVGCYGKAAQFSVNCDIFGVNDNDANTERVSKTVFLDSVNEEETLTFTTGDFTGGGIYSFSYLHVYINESDGFEYDNSYYYFGGQREKIKIQYASTNPNTFFQTICRNFRTQLKDRWDVEYTILRSDETAAMEGFDLYIFEHKMPDTLPQDGVVLLIDPDKAPVDSGLRLGDRMTVSSDSTLALGVEHAVNKFVNADNIAISNYRKIVSSDGYEPLLYYAQEPVMLVKNESKAKIFVCAVDLNYTDMGICKEFPLIMINLFNYFFPSTLTDYAFEIGDTLTLNARGEGLNVSAPNEQPFYFDELPAEYKVNAPGTYTLMQNGLNNEPIIENFFVKVPNFESNITKEVDALPLLHVTTKQEYSDKDLLLYFAAALAALMFAEWLLQSREYFR